MRIRLRAPTFFPRWPGDQNSGGDSSYIVIATDDYDAPAAQSLAVKIRAVPRPSMVRASLAEDNRCDPVSAFGQLPHSS